MWYNAYCCIILVNKIQGFYIPEKERKMNIYVGNISYQLDESGLEAAFAEYGEVDSARIISDRDSGRSKGFGFVEMPNQTEGEAAIQNLNGKELEGRELKVNEARPRENRPSRPRY